MQEADRFIGERAVGPAAVGDHFSVPGQLAKPAAKLGQRDGDSARQMPSGILFCRADVQDNEVFTMLQAPKQLGATNRLQRVPRSEIGVSELAYLGPSLDRNSAQVAPEVKDLRIVEGITDVSPLPPPEDQADFAQHLQVLTGIGNRHAGLGSQTLDGTFAVRKYVQNL